VDPQVVAGDGEHKGREDGNAPEAGDDPRMYLPLPWEIYGAVPAGEASGKRCEEVGKRKSENEKYKRHPSLPSQENRMAMYHRSSNIGQKLPEGTCPYFPTTFIWDFIPKPHPGQW
jgi:hypothetical protein